MKRFVLMTAAMFVSATALIAETNAVLDLTTKAMAHSEQIVLQFADKVKVDYQIDKDSGNLMITLDGIGQSALNKSGIVKKLSKLAFLKQAVVTADVRESKNEVSMLILSFAVPGLKLSINSFDKPYQLVIDLISEGALRKALAKNNAHIISHAYNQSIACGSALAVA
jgi:hypothetical protein